MSPNWWWIVFIASLATGISESKSDTTASPDIPKHLLECYTDEGIYHKANRFANSYESFLDLIRKIEENSNSRNMNGRELSLVLLHYLKLDGIQSLQSHAKPSSNIVPFAPSGDEYFRHRLTLIGLVPRIDQNYLHLINESLTKKELCNLHFMLSYSIDPYKRENERCTPIYEEIISESYGKPENDWNPYEMSSGRWPGRGRSKRNSNGEKESIRKREIKRLRRILEKRTLESLKNGDSDFISDRELKEHENDLKKVENMLRRRRRRRSSRSGDGNDDKKAEVEAIAIHHGKKQNKEGKVMEKGKFTIGSHELLGASESHAKGLRSVVPDRYGGRSLSKTRYVDGASTYSGPIPGIPLSDCPSVNGIVATPFGSLAMGTVIAGIAAGLNPQEIPPVKLNVDPSEMENSMDRMNNIWATTLAGVVADTLTSSAVLEMDNGNLQILKGGWNDSVIPRWYLLKSNQFKHLTEVALRGSLDGLFLGMSAKELTNKYSNFKLSDLLQIYYEYFWGNVGAKNRVQMRPQYAPDETFAKQLQLMLLVLKKQKTNVLTILDPNLLSRQAVAMVTNFIQHMDEKTDPPNERNPPKRIDVSVNAVAVIDSSWGHDTLSMIFREMRIAKVAATPHHSNLTVICGSNGRILMSAEIGLDLDRFTKEMLVENCTRGMDFPLVLDSLEFFYRKLYQEEETGNKVNSQSQVAILFPYDIFPAENQEETAIKMLEFQNVFPDVRLMIAANGRSDVFSHFVKNKTDLFSIVPPSIDPKMKSIKEFVGGIKLSYQRISRPSCGSYFDDDSQGTEIRFVNDVFPEETVHYRLLPQYFFGSRGLVTVTVRSKQRAPLTVCHSREVERPEDLKSVKSDSPRYPPDANYRFGSEYSSDRQTNSEEGSYFCKTITSEVYKIEMNDPCYEAYTLDECRPLYITIRPPEQPLTIICSSCRLHFNVQYEISANGLTCYNGAISIATSRLPVILCLLFLAVKFRIL